jgi:hypothetical protein
MTFSKRYKTYRNDLRMSRRQALRVMFRGTRLYGAFCLLRGQTVIYRATISGGSVVCKQAVWAKDNHFSS